VISVNELQEQGVNKPRNSREILYENILKLGSNHVACKLLKLHCNEWCKITAVNISVFPFGYGINFKYLRIYL
jgi:hypothetical protein